MANQSSTEYAAVARAKKRAEAKSVGIDHSYISDMVETFYGKIRNDPLLGPIFASQVDDWPLHLRRMKVFWRSVLLNSGEYSGNPMQKHKAIPGLELAHFNRWLELFFEALRMMEAHPEASRQVAGRARNIAASLLLSRMVSTDDISGINVERDLLHVP